MNDTISKPNDPTGQLRSVLREVWGYDSFRPLQREAMQAALGGRDSLVVLPTGGGKSLCYQAPAMCLPGTAVVVSPLISLMKDQVDAARACGVPAAFLNSTQLVEERRETMQELRQGGIRLLYVSPERILQLDMLRELGEISVSLIAIDEAHCVSQWGHDFRPQYRELRVLRERFPDISLHAFTATATERVRSDVIEQLSLRDPEVLVGNFDRPNLTYRVERKRHVQRQIQEVLDRHRGESGIIYCITRKEVEQRAEMLASLGYRARPYHAGMPDRERRANQEAFIEDEVDIIVATVAFGMGIDKSNVRFVIHAGMPQSLEHYQQESGRAGRDGLEAECWLFYGGGDFRKWEQIFSDQPPPVRKASLHALRGIADFCEGVVCRHRALVRHFGQDLAEDCKTACDLCLEEHDVVPDALTVGQKILSSVYRQQQRFGAEYTALVLKGSQSQRIIENGHDRLSTYGLLKDESKQTILDWIGQLVQQGFLAKTGEYNVLTITEEGSRLLKGEATPRLLQSQRPDPKEAAPARPRTDPESWEGVDRTLFELLRNERLAAAREKGLPPYMVFSDATLRDLARRRPSNADALLEVYGVGNLKAKNYGERFLERIAAYCQEHDVARDVGPPGASPPPARQPDAEVTASAVQAFPMFEEEASIEEVMQQLDRARSTVVKYLTTFLIERRIEDASPWVPKETIARIEEAVEHVGMQRLKPIFEHLNGEVDYDSIRIALTCRNNRHAT
jgi:ATP-dependent DNA helicase RecQ